MRAVRVCGVGVFAFSFLIVAVSAVASVFDIDTNVDTGNATILRLSFWSWLAMLLSSIALVVAGAVELAQGTPWKSVLRWWVAAALVVCGLILSQTVT